MSRIPRNNSNAMVMMALLGVGIFLIATMWYDSSVGVFDAHGKIVWKDARYEINEKRRSGSGGDVVGSNGVVDENENRPVVPPGLTFDPDLEQYTTAGLINSKKLVEDWGQWQFQDLKEKSRPMDDFFAKANDRDISGEDFPADAWQIDPDYLSGFIEEGIHLVSRAKKAIHAEYGYTADNQKESQEVFGIELVDFTKVEKPPSAFLRRGRGLSGSGWLTIEAMESLKRRLLHAMMTNDQFTIVLAGHSSAAGHGNHFLQSYIMQAHHVLEPIFYRLGMKLVTKNIAQGGLGTTQTALGSRDIYGSEIDVLIWDTHMTEPDDHSIELFMRQALLGGNRSPVLLGGNWSVLKMLHDKVGAHVGDIGTDKTKITTTTGEVQGKSLPFAVQFLNCEATVKALCNNDKNRYRSTCWIPRNDFTPERKQAGFVGGRASWHPGFREHKLQGRRIAYIIIEALAAALNDWKMETNSGRVPLSSNFWHMNDVYEGIRTKIETIEDSYCEEKFFFMKRICKIGLNGRSEWTPRNDPMRTSIRSLMFPDADGYIPNVGKDVVYDPPDVEIPTLLVPEGEIDVRAILSSGISKRQTIQMPKERLHLSKQQKDFSHSTIKPGNGTYLYDHKSGLCDGTWSSWCERDKSTSCLLSGHNDARGGILFDPFSGWIVLNLDEVKRGIILVKLDLMKINNPRTSHMAPIKIWNVHGGRHLHDLQSFENSVGRTPLLEDRIFVNEWSSRGVGSRRRLRVILPPDMGTFRDPSCALEYSIDGNITKLNKDSIIDLGQNIQRVVTIYPLLDDETFESRRNVEVALRIVDCDVQYGATYRLTHVYWA